jgi:hypothetical protein
MNMSCVEGMSTTIVIVIVMIVIMDLNSQLYKSYYIFLVFSESMGNLFDKWSCFPKTPISQEVLVVSIMVFFRNTSLILYRVQCFNNWSWQWILGLESSGMCHHVVFRQVPTFWRKLFTHHDFPEDYNLECYLLRVDTGCIEQYVRSTYSLYCQLHWD